VAGKLLASKIVIQEEEPRVRSMQGRDTAVLAIAGVTQRGPFVATQLTTWEEYLRLFGGFTTNSDVALAIRMWFLAGGGEAWVKRVVHHTDITDASTQTAVQATKNIAQASGGTATKGSVTSSGVEPFNLAHGGTIVVDNELGADGTVTLSATAAIVTGAGGLFGAMDNETMEVQVGEGDVQDVSFATEATIALAIQTMNQQLTGCHVEAVDANNVKIISDQKGTGARIRTTNVAAGIDTKLGLDAAGEDESGTGNVEDVDAVTAQEMVDLLNGQLSTITATVVAGAVKLERDTAGSTKSVQVTAASTMDDEMGFDNTAHAGTDATAADTLQIDGKTHGAYGNSLQLVVEAATSGTATQFNLSVVNSVTGATEEVWTNLSMTSTDDTYVEDVINAETGGSNLIAATDLGLGSDKRPANGTYSMISGDDGLTSIADADYIGDEAALTGMYGFDSATSTTILAVPGQTSQAMQLAMLDYADRSDGRLFAILDSPQSTTASAMAALMASRGYTNYTENGAIFWPWVKVVNPSALIYGSGTTITIPPTGAVIGALARTDKARVGGVYDAPAGEEDGRLIGVVGLETDEALDERKRDLVYPTRCNPMNGKPYFIDGSRTLKGNGNFPSIPERRGVSSIEQTIKAGLSWVRHKHNDGETRARVYRTIRAYLLEQMRNRAFASQNPDTAFFIDASEALNPPSVVAQKKMIIRVGLATASPAEFIVLSFSQDTRALEQEILGAV